MQQQPDRSDLFDDPVAQLRDLRQRKEELREEAKTATAERRTEIGWWMWGASKHEGRLVGILTARRLNEHRFVIHEVDGGDVWALCSCSAKFAGRMHEDFTLAEFPSLPGHVIRGDAVSGE